MPGPPKLPTALKLIKGTLRPGRVAKNEPRPKAAVPDAPENLSPDALVEWNRVVNEIKELGVLTLLDRAILALYCQAWSDFMAASRNVNQFKHVIQTKSDNYVENPYYSVQKRAAEQVRMFGAELGLTPAARTKISAIESDDEKESASRKYFN